MDVGKLGLQETVNQASGALQKNQNGADIPNKDKFIQNTGACRAFSGQTDIDGSQGAWSTVAFISWLENNGGFCELPLCRLNDIFSRF